MGNEAKDRKPLGFWGNFGIGCLLDVVLIVVFALIVMDAERVGHALGYALGLSIVVWGIRWLLNQLNLLDGWCGRLIGPVALVGAMLLAVFCPLKTGEDSEAPAGEADDASPIAEQELSGVRYTPASTNDVSVEAALAELDELVGLKPVKERVTRFAKQVRVDRLRRGKNLNAAPKSYHMVFTGNPGTGKTSVARIMAKIFKALGVVKKGQLVECDRGALVAGYTGQTAIKTGKVIDAALDGVLFIDEAYSLVNGPQDSYGAEAISTLLKRMEDDRDRLVVIVAGYTDEMKTFIDANSGLASRFTRYVEFPDYTAEELSAIFRMNVKKSEYELSPDVEKWLDAFIRVRTKDRDRKFGNGRWARSLFEEAVSHQAVRLSRIANPTSEQLKALTMKDVGIRLKDPDASKED